MNEEKGMTVEERRRRRWGKCNVQKYFHDILNRVVVTVKDELVSILPHKWVEPVTIPLFY